MTKDIQQLAQELATNIKTEKDLNEFTAMLKKLTIESALNAELRKHSRVINKSVYLALGINLEGCKELLGMWIYQNEGAKFWLSVMMEIKNRGIEEILIVCIDGLKGFPDAISSVFPQTDIQLYIVHVVRNSLRFVSWKDYKAVIKGLKEIYQTTTEENALITLDLFEKHWINQYPKIAESWRNHWDNIRSIFD